MVIQVLNSKLGITLRVSVTSACLCIFVYGSLGREDDCSMLCVAHKWTTEHT